MVLLSIQLLTTVINLLIEYLPLALWADRISIHQSTVTLCSNYCMKEIVYYRLSYRLNPGVW